VGALLESVIAQSGGRHFLDFDGIDDYASIPDSDALSVGDGITDTPLTFEAWVRPDSITTKQNLISKWGDSGNQEYRLYIASGIIRLDLFDNSSQAMATAYTSNNQAALVGGWHHLAVTYDGRGGSTAANGIVIYIDGVAVAVTRSNNASYVSMENGTAALQLGRESPSYKQYGGGLDEVRIWNAVRTQGQIQAHMWAELNVGAEVGLLAYWTCNEGSGVSLTDDSLHGLTATLFNNPAWMSGGMVAPSDPDVTPPEIANVAVGSVTHSSAVITYTTNEATTGWVSITTTGSCPCTDVFSPAVGTTHTINLTGLASESLYTFHAHARDAADNPQVSPAMSFTTLVAPPDTTPPTISISRPSAGSVAGTVLVEADATDVSGVAGVQFRLDGAELGVEDVASPYSVSWDTTTAADGLHTITAEARDALGNISVASVAVTVSNTVVPSTPHYLELDGVDDFLSVDDADGVSFGNGVSDGPLTFEMWLNADSLTGKQTLIQKGSGSSNPEYKLYFASGVMRLDLFDRSVPATVTAYTTIPISLVGSWHHVAVTYDGRGGSLAANGITFYIDGIAVAVTRVNNPAYVAMENGPAGLHIGRESPSFHQYDGALDEIRIWAAARTQNQIQTYLSLELPASSEQGLAAYWKFNEGSGVSAEDGSLNGHSATLVNGPLWRPGGPITPSDPHPPSITSAASVAFTSGSPGSFTVIASGFPVPTFISSGALPPGVTLVDNGNGTATLSGTPASGSSGIYPLTITATNGVGAPAAQAFTLTVTQTVAITSAAATTFSFGSAGSFTVTAAGFPVPTLVVTGALPAGVTATDNGDGTATLSGAPAEAGAYPLSVTAANGSGSPLTQAFTLTVAQSPAITSIASTTFVVGSAGSAIVTTSGFPLPTLTLSGSLPSGVTFTGNGDGTATVAGTPASGSGGTYALTLTAGNGAGVVATQNFTLTIAQPPAITSVAAVSFPIAVPSSFALTATGFPSPTFAASGALPPGVSLTDNGNGTATIAGTPEPGSGGPYALTLSAGNGVGTPATQLFTLTVQACTVSPPAGALPAATFEAAYAFAFNASGGAGHTFAVTAGSLPAGLSLSSGGVLTGSPTTTGAFMVTVTATNSTGCVASSTYSLSVRPDALDETFQNGVGNTQYSVGAGAPSTPAIVAAGTVLSNDRGSGTLVAGPAVIATARGGHVAMSALGTFLYTPPVGFAGPSDTFTYTLTDGNGAMDTAVVTIGVSGIVWFVNAASGAGDGRSHSPFDSMTAASVSAQPGHTIYVHQGSPSGATTLKMGQTLWGAGAMFTSNALIIPATSSPTLLGTVTLADNVVVNAVSVNGGGSAAIVANGLTGNQLLTGVSLVGGSTGLQLVGLAGSLTMSGGSISNVTGTDVLVAGGTGDVSIGASIVNTAGRSLDVQHRAGGSVTFSGAINDTGNGILLNDNAGSAFAFTGGLALSTGASSALMAMNSGSLTVTQDNVAVINTITTTSGTALNVTNTEIGGAGLTFRSISAGTAAYTTGVGIVLDNTGVDAGNGGLTITGNGTAQSGGIIRRKSGPDGSTTSGVGIYLSRTLNPSFNRMDLNRFDNSAIIGREVTGFLLADSVISTAGNATGVMEGPVVFGLPASVTGLQGTGIIRNTLITGGVEDNVAFYNQSGTMSLLIESTTGTYTDCQIGANSTTTGGRGLVLQMEAVATASVTVNRCQFRNNRTTGLLASASGESRVTLTVTGSPTDENLRSYFTRGSSGQGQDGIVVVNADDAHITATIENSYVSGFAGAGIRIGQAAGNASALSMLRASIISNKIESGFGPASEGIIGRFSSRLGEVAQSRLLIQDNTTPLASGLNQYGPLPAIAISTPDPGTTPNVDVTMVNNHIDMREFPAGSGIRGPIGVSIQSTRGDVCANVLSNISHWYPTGINPQGGGIRLEQSAGGVFRLERGLTLLETPASTVLEVNNPAPALTTMVTEALGSVATVENGTCRLPSNP
jgi:hypothetical protein